jgi:hypothetical protein
MEQIEVRGVGKNLPKPPSSSSAIKSIDTLIKESNSRIQKVTNCVAGNKPEEVSHNVKSLTSLNLETNPKFIELRQKLEEYYLDNKCENPKLHPKHSSEWRRVLYVSLQKLLNEVVFTKTKALQAEVLDRVYNWYYEKTSIRVLTPTPAETVAEIPREPSVPVFDLEDDQLTENSELPIKKLQKYNRRTLQSASTARPSTAASPPPKMFSRPPTAKTTGLPFTTTNFTQEPKSDSNLKTTFTKYVPAGIDAERRMEARYQALRRKEIEDRRVQEEMKQKIHAWSSYRARKNEDFIRKVEGNRFASRFEMRAFSPSGPPSEVEKSTTAVVIDMRENMASDLNKSGTDGGKDTSHEIQVDSAKADRVFEIRKLYGSLIGTEVSNNEFADNSVDKNPEAISLAAYSRGNSGMWSRPVSQYRPRTAGSLPRPSTAATKGLTGQNSGINEDRSFQIREISEIKRRLAKNSVPCAVDTLSLALLSPLDLPEEKLTRNYLPNEGSTLFANPAFNIKKGKKGKKKVKGKKKGKKKP